MIGAIMDTEKESKKTPVSYYGKKIYYINPLIADKIVPPENKPEKLYEDIAVDQDKYS